MHCEQTPVMQKMWHVWKYSQMKCDVRMMTQMWLLKNWGKRWGNKAEEEDAGEEHSVHSLKYVHRPCRYLSALWGIHMWDTICSAGDSHLISGLSF